MSDSEGVTREQAARRLLDVLPPLPLLTPREQYDEPETLLYYIRFGKTPANEVEVMVEIGDDGVIDVAWNEIRHAKGEREGHFFFAMETAIEEARKALPQKFLHALKRHTLPPSDLIVLANDPDAPNIAGDHFALIDNAKK